MTESIKQESPVPDTPGATTMSEDEMYGSPSSLAEENSELRSRLQVLENVLAETERKTLEEAAKVADEMANAASSRLASGHNADAAVQFDVAEEIARVIRALATQGKHEQLEKSNAKENTNAST